MLEIYLIRHGETVWNKEKRMQGSLNSNLTEEGYNQAKALNKHLQLTQFDQIITSDIERALITSSLIFEDKDIKLSKGVREIGMGKWEGMRYGTIMSEYPEQWTNFFMAPDLYEPVGDGETYDDLRQRLIEFISTEIDGRDNERIAVVSHRITLRMLASILLKDPSLFSTLDLDPTSYSVLQINDDSIEIVTLNNTSHYSLT